MTDTPTDTERAREIANDQEASAWHVARFCRGAANLDDAFALVYQALERVRREERERCIIEWRTAIFELCEHIEGIEGDDAFMRARRYEAKCIRRTMGELMSEAIRSDGGNGNE